MGARPSTIGFIVGLPNLTSPIRTKLVLETKIKASSLSEIIRMVLRTDVDPGSSDPCKDNS
jgi:hypothetical protein